jgi:predicted kinase
MKAIIVDLDGTLANCAHRQHHARTRPANWDAFFDGIPDDTAYEPVVWLVNEMAERGVKIILCSGRPESHRPQTLDWLMRYGVVFHELNMRATDDRRADWIVKEQMLSAILADGDDVIFSVDDRDVVVEMWRRNGITCLQARDWNEPCDYEPGLLTLMVGPSGAGKTSWLHSDQARELGILPRHIISSDDVRADLCGDFRCQDKNEQVFSAMHAIARDRLAYGLKTVLDATNLRRKDRLACVSCAPIDGSVRYIVIDRPLDEKLRDSGWRAEVPGLIERHHQTFKSQLADILKGDNLPNVSVIDLRVAK